MTIYWGPTDDDWETRVAPDTSWLYVAPLSAKPTYPVVLDVAESAVAVAPHGLVLSVRQALAPAWDDFRPCPTTRAAPKWRDIQREDDDALEAYLLGAAARATASLGSRYGVVLENPQYYDESSAFFVRRLLTAARSSGLSIAIKARPSVADDPRFHLGGTSVQVVASRPRMRPTIDLSCLGHRLLACCPQGAPVEALRALGVPLGELDGLTCPGPGNAIWAYLPTRLQRRALAGIAEPLRRESQRLVFDAWPPEGWGYLRRATLALASEDIPRLLAQHACYLQGSLNVGRGFLYHHYAVLARSLSREEPASPYIVPALVCAARLAPWLGKALDTKMAIRHYRSALRRVADPVEKTALIYELANSYALQRQPAALVEARRLYKRGFATLSQIKSAEDHVRLKITLLNGLALVEYHEGHNNEALALERQAQSMVSKAAKDFPHLAEWATTLLNINVAKLLERRFGDVPGAIVLLRQTIEQVDDVEVRVRICNDLSRVYFDHGDHHAVVAVLSNIYEWGCPVIVSERRELLGRLMFTVSLVALGDFQRARCQLKRLDELSQAMEALGAARLVAVLSRACAAREELLQMDLQIGEHKKLGAGRPPAG